MSNTMKSLSHRSVERTIWIIQQLKDNTDGMTAVELTNGYNETHEDKFDRKSCYNYFGYAKDYFGIIIDHKAASPKYFLLNPEVIEDGSIIQFVYTTIGVGEIVNDCKSLGNRVLLEPVYVGIEFLHTILKSMIANKRIILEYKKYYSDVIEVVKIDSYCVKSYQSRLYVLGKKENGEFRTYCFDRICALKTTKEQFVLDARFDASDYFKDVFGIIKDENCPPRRIVLKVKDHQVEYVKRAPLHHSQKPLECGEGWGTFEYFLSPTKDFIAAILRQGKFIEVMEPLEIRKEIKKELKDAYDQYARVRISKAFRASFLGKTIDIIFAL